MPALTFRTAVESDLDRVIEIHTSAFPDPRRFAERQRNFTANPLGSLDALWLAMAGEDIVAHAFLFSLRAWFAGAMVPIGAIASVGVAPEARGRGIAGAFLAHLHAQADAQKACATILYAFRQGFYATHGYAAVTPNRRLRLHPASIPPAWRSDTVRAARGADDGADRAAIVHAYARAAARTHGWLVRPTALWDHHFADERRVWMVATHGAHGAHGAHGKRVTGYVCWSLVQSEAHAATRLVAHEIAADDDASRRALLGAVGAQRDQVAEVEIELDACDPLDRALVDADRARFGTSEVEHALGTVSGGPMVRLVDVVRGISGRAYAGHGAIDLVIGARPAIHLAVADGKAKVSVPRHARAPLTIDRPALAAVLYGGLTPTDAVRLGWAHGDEATLARADAIFATPPFFALDVY